MRKIASLAALFLCSALIVAMFVVPVKAQGEGFTETFDDAQLPGWEHSPEVIISDGVLRIAPHNFAARMGVWGNFDLSLDLFFEGDGATEIQYHTTDNGAYSLIFTTDRLSLLRTSQPGSEPVELAGAALGAEAAAGWFTVRITLLDGSHTIYINGSQQLTASDASPIQSGGLIIISQGGRTTEVDDIIMTIVTTGETVPLEQPQQPVPAETQTTAVQSADTSWQTFLQSLLWVQGTSFDLGTIALNLAFAVVTSFILSRVYVYWGASLSNRRKFAANFMLVTITTTFIILIVRSSVALSLGLVGALSIIRFRAAIKEPEELAYLFFAISLGIGLGDNQRLVTLLSLVVVIIVLGLSRLLRQTQSDVNLNLTVSSRSPRKVTMPQVMDTLEKHCAKLRLMRYDENDQVLEMSFVIEFRHTSDLNKAREALMKLSEKLEIAFMDNKGIW